MWHIQRIVLQSISRWFIIFIIAFATLRWCGCAIAHANGNASSSHATVAFTGDVLLDRGVRDAVKCMNVSDLVRDIRIALHRIDIAFCNLECPISERASKLPKPASFRAPPAMLSVLRAVGFNLVSLANNHTMDCGKAGLVDTMDALRKRGIAFVGAGRNRAEAHEPLVMTINGVRIAFLAYSDFPPEGIFLLHDAPCIAIAYDDAIRRDILRARAIADAVIVSFHWGIEFTTRVTRRQRLLAQRALSAGADLVIGHHPHVLQPMGWRYNGFGRHAYVAYSLGNFIFDLQRHDATETVILRCTFTRSGLTNVMLIPMIIRKCIPRLPNRVTAVRILRRIEWMSFACRLEIAEHRIGDGSVQFIVGNVMKSP